MLSTRLAQTTSAVLLATPLAFADVLVVAANGSGDFTDLQPAIDAAVDGDTLLVKTGSYMGGLIVGKELDVVADDGAVVAINGAMRVRALPGGRHVLLAGLKVMGAPATSATDRFALYVKQCSGSVRIENCELFGADAVDPEYYTHVAVVENCLDVAVTRSTLEAGDDTGGKGMDATSAWVAIYDSTVLGGSAVGHGHPGNHGGTGGDGFDGTQSFLFTAGSRFEGAHGGDSSQQIAVTCVCGGHGGSGVSLGDRSHELPDLFFINSTAAALDTTATGAPGGLGNNFGCGLCGSSICWSCPGYAGLPILGLSATTLLSGSARSLLGPNLMREGTSTTVYFTGAPDDEVSLFVGSAGDFEYSATVRGTYLVERPTKRLRIGRIGVHSFYAYTFTAPTLASGEQSRTVFLQALHRSTSGEYTLGAPLTIAVVDSAF